MACRLSMEVYFLAWVSCWLKSDGTDRCKNEEWEAHKERWQLEKIERWRTGCEKEEEMDPRAQSIPRQCQGRYVLVKTPQIISNRNVALTLKIIGGVYLIRSATSKTQQCNSLKKYSCHLLLGKTHQVELTHLRVPTALCLRVRVCVFVFYVMVCLCLLSSGQGFAFSRKEKVRHEYNKLLRKGKKNTPESKQLYKEEYPEHLQHLYLAEAEKLRNEAWTNRLNRSKLRMKGRQKGEEMGEKEDAARQGEKEDAAGQGEAADPEVTGGPELTDSVAESSEPAAAAEKERWGSLRCRRYNINVNSCDSSSVVFFFIVFQSSAEQSHEEKNAEEDVLSEDERGIWGSERKTEKKERGDLFFSVWTLCWLCTSRSPCCVCISLFICLIPGVPEEQAAERRSHSKVQREKDGDVSDAQQENKEGAAQSEPPNGVSASKDPRNWEMTPIMADAGAGVGRRASPSCLWLIWEETKVGL